MTGSWRGVRKLFPHGLLLGTVIVLSFTTILFFSCSFAFILYSNSISPDNALLSNLLLVAYICHNVNVCYIISSSISCPDPVLQYLLSDFIVVWRAWVLLVRRRSRIALGIIFLITVGKYTSSTSLTLTKLDLWRVHNHCLCYHGDSSHNTASPVEMVVHRWYLFLRSNWSC